MGKCALGLDFGTESVRALAVDCATGQEVARAYCYFQHGVIEERLPDGGPALEPDSALQHPGDYLSCLHAVLAEVLQACPAQDIAGIGLDFTACTMLPVDAAGVPLMARPEHSAEPQAWVKLWKHHAAQPQAAAISARARERREPFLAYYSGQVSSEWMLPKCFETLVKAPAVFQAADAFVEAGDWIVEQMTGQRTRNACAAGYKGLWNAEHGFPSREFLRALDPRLESLASKWCTVVSAPGHRAGVVGEAFAEVTGLKAGTPVSAATIDAHAGMPGMGVAESGVMGLILGTSACHMLLADELKLFEGYAGVVQDGILQGFLGYESGQAAVGDVFGWFAKRFLPPSGGDPFADLSREAAALQPGESGLLALDWWNGNRSPLMNPDLSGLVVGFTLATRPHEVYRALVEATAFGTRQIIDGYEEAGVPVRRLVACGGLTTDPFLLQTFADVTGRPIEVAASSQAVALGAAIFGALAAGAAAGGYDSVTDAIAAMTAPAVSRYVPEATHRNAYDRLYSLHTRLARRFGVEERDLMAELKQMKHQAKEP